MRSPDIRWEPVLEERVPSTLACICAFEDRSYEFTVYATVGAVMALYQSRRDLDTKITGWYRGRIVEARTRGTASHG